MAKEVSIQKMKAFQHALVLPLPFFYHYYLAAQKVICMDCVQEAPYPALNMVRLLIFEAHMPKIKSTHVVLEYGKPIYVKELSKEDQKHLGTYTQNIIYEMLEKNKSLI